MKTTSELDAFIKLLLQFSKLVDVFGQISQTVPNDTINELKIEVVNDLLAQANGSVSRNNKPFTQFQQFSDGPLPSNSDVYLILSQYLACLKKYAHDQIRLQDSKAYWVINNRKTIIEADLEQLKLI
jgi:hypothetical protein